MTHSCRRPPAARTPAPCLPPIDSIRSDSSSPGKATQWLVAEISAVATKEKQLHLINTKNSWLQQQHYILQVLTIYRREELAEPGVGEKLVVLLVVRLQGAGRC